MKISFKGIALIKKLEGCRLTVYDDQAGLPTIGIGHLLTRTENVSGKIWIGGEPYIIYNGLTEELCIELLKQDLQVPVDTVNQAVQVPLNQNQFDALVSFVFNIGCTRFRNSTVLQVINAGRLDRVPKEMRRWVYVNDKVSKGLQNRREAEIRLWNTPVENETPVDSMLPIDFIDPPEPHRPWYKRLFGMRYD
ncbi:MAG TPA: lysozyme [bacterium]|nr:lysozyme [bacterium]HQI48758.1 lysozyme [bacterium]HQJ66493.1 lysozyme [bacterium]